MIIEFIGIPGSGKSALMVFAREILKEIGLKALPRVEAGMVCLKRTPFGKAVCFFTPQKHQDKALWGFLRRLLFFYKIKFIIGNWKLTRYSIELLWNEGLSLKEKRLLLGYFFQIGSYYEYFPSRLQNGEALILSEGLAHRITSLHHPQFGQPNPFKILNYLKLLPQLNLIISVQTAFETCFARLEKRGGHKRFQGDELKSFLITTDKTVRIALQALKEQGYNLIELNNNGSLSSSRKILEELLIGINGKLVDKRTIEGHESVLL